MALAKRLLGVWQDFDARRHQDQADQRMAEDRQQQQQDDEFRRLAMMAALSKEGIVRGDERQNITADLPDVGTIGGPMPRRPAQTVDTGLVDPSRYQSLGRAGGQDYYRDRAQEIAAQREAQRKARLDEAFRNSEIEKNKADAAKAMRPDKPEVPSYQFVPDGKGNVIGINPKNPSDQRQTGIVKPTEEPAGASDIRKQLNAVAAARQILKDLASEVEKNGTEVDPRSARQATLASNYQNFSIQLKNIFQLGAISATDYAMMQATLSDPTSMKARVMAGGEANQRQRFLAQAKAIDKAFEDNANRLSSQIPNPPKSGSAPAIDVNALYKKHHLEMP